MRVPTMVFAALLLTAGGLLAAELPDDDTRWVKAEGTAAVIDGDIPQARDEAIVDARVRAVEAVLGAHVDAETIVQDELLLLSMVRCSSAGYVRNTRVTDEWRDDAGIYHISIEALVQPSRLRADIAEELCGRISVAITVEETIDGVPVEPPIVSDSLAARLVEAGFRVIDAGQAARLQARDASMAVAGRDADAAAAIGLRFLAGVVITGSARARFSQDNAGIISSTGRASLKAVAGDTGETIATAGPLTVKGFALDKYQAGEKALGAVARSLNGEDDLVRCLVDHAGRTQRRIVFEVTGLKDRAASARFVSFLTALRWVGNVECTGFSASRSRFVASYANPTIFIATRIDRRAEYSVLQYSRNRVTVKTVDGGQ